MSSAETHLHTYICIDIDIDVDIVYIGMFAQVYDDW